MIKTLQSVIQRNKNGLFLLDLPTGFGKTTAVVEIIKDFIRGNPIYKGVKRIFFVTNLITNLPYGELIKQLDEQEKSVCFQAKATIDYVLENFLKTHIDNAEVLHSKQYINLKSEIESYHELKKSLVDNVESNFKPIKGLEILKQKISTDTEPAFRKFIKTSFIYNKSIADRKRFISENAWLRYLYPICDIENYKVIFLTTKKFISPIDTFRRLPFYAYNDDITKDSLVFVDEFDSTKNVVLDQVVEDGLKNRIDIVSLFLDLHYALQHTSIPQRMLNTTDYNKEKVAEGKWYTTEQHFDFWRKRFDEKYNEHELTLLMKSVNFTYDKAFLFDDGKYFNIVKDNSRKFIYASSDAKERILALRGMDYSPNLKPINKIIRDLENCIDGFTKSMFYIYNNYLYYKNAGKSSIEIKYTPEEAIYTVLDLLNLGEEHKEYLFNKILTSEYIFEKPTQYVEMRKGFNYTVIEDSNYHDMKSIVRSYYFPTTPEDVFIKLSQHALVVGISATAKVKTCIGNYDLKYLRSELKDKFIETNKIDEQRMADDFSSIVNKLDGQYKIKVQIVDDFGLFSDREKCARLITDLFIGENFTKYSQLLENQKTDFYYYLMELKLALMYKYICENNIKSFIAFLNRRPTPNGKLDSQRLDGLFEDLCLQNGYEKIRHEVLTSQNFDITFRSIQKDLEQGKPVFVITTYQTVGTGKNIQYNISKATEDSVIYDPTDTRVKKDFEGIYLATPTNLIQRLSFESENKYDDLSKFLFHQEYLYKNKYLTYPQMKSNIVYGFKQIFYGINSAHYTKNGDIYFNTLRVAIQAVGRICRCRHKNKLIYIYADKELVERVQRACDIERPKLLNKEFSEILDLKVSNSVLPAKLKEYSQQSKDTYTSIKKKSCVLRSSKNAIWDWQDLREFVLKNPTTSNPGKYKDYYFEFDAKYSGYSYKQNNRYDIVELLMDTRYDMHQVSEQECDLPTILSIDCVEKMFEEKRYAKIFKKEKYIMSPSLFKQVYLGVLGEVVGKCILESGLGLDLENLDDLTFYEYFDYKIGNIYFDFKHWHLYEANNDLQVKKVENKLAKIKGAKCFVINLVKRNDAPAKINIGETVIQIPYLIDGNEGTVNSEAIELIENLLG